MIAIVFLELPTVVTLDILPVGPEIGGAEFPAPAEDNRAKGIRAVLEARATPVPGL
jgi:hypothetical protein